MVVDAAHFVLVRQAVGARDDGAERLGVPLDERGDERLLRDARRGAEDEELRLPAHGLHALAEDERGDGLGAECRLHAVEDGAAARVRPEVLPRPPGEPEEHGVLVRGRLVEDLWRPRAGRRFSS